MTKILVVEDTKYWRVWIAQALSGTQTLLTFAENGKLGVEKIEEDSDYKAIIMNVKMPIMNGYEATQKIRELGYTRPIIGHSSFYDLACVRMAFKTGMSHYLLRTHYMEDLQGVLHHLGLVKLKSIPPQWNKDYFFTKNVL